MAEVVGKAELVSKAGLVIISGLSKKVPSTTFLYCSYSIGDISPDAVSAVGENTSETRNPEFRKSFLSTISEFLYILQKSAPCALVDVRLIIKSAVKSAIPEFCSEGM